MMTRQEVYNAIDLEREYQKQKYGATLSSNRPGDGGRTLDEMALYLTGLGLQLAQVASTSSDCNAKLALVLKITALGVQCMEQHGVAVRPYSSGS